MKKLFIIIILMSGISFVGNAQKTEKKSARTHKNKNLTPAEKAGKSAAKATKNLGLNETQAENWKTAALKKEELNRPLKEQLKKEKNREKKKEINLQIEANNKSFESKTNSILTEEQMAKKKQLKKDKKKK